MAHAFAQPESSALRYYFVLTEAAEMIDHRKLDDLMDKLAGVLPDSVKHMQHDIETNMRAILENGLRKMNLVSREEFEVQTALLARLQERVKQLEQELKSR
jgi:BMFP domain-containing protein YqiC